MNRPFTRKVTLRIAAQRALIRMGVYVPSGRRPTVVVVCTVHLERSRRRHHQGTGTFAAKTRRFRNPVIRPSLPGHQSSSSFTGKYEDTHINRFRHERKPLQDCVSYIDGKARLPRYLVMPHCIRLGLHTLTLLGRVAKGFQRTCVSCPGGQ